MKLGFFRFTTDFLNNDSEKIDAIIVGSEFASSYEYSQLFWYMGFKSVDEYIGSYPGKFSTDSKFCIITNADCDDAKINSCLSDDCHTLNLLYSFFRSENTMWEYISIQEFKSYIYNNVMNNNIIMLPKIDEVLSWCEEFKRDRLRDLWFCYDWEEELLN